MNPAYPLAILGGLAAAWWLRRRQPAEPPAVAAHRPLLLAAAAVGAVLGAYLGDLPAGWLGWDLGEGHRLGGRTVLGGLLGGWLAVEAAKRLVGLRVATGDGFAAPLAAALACGRAGCLFAGCCGPAWTTVVEVVFHAGACALLLFAGARQRLAGRRLACYLTLYAVLRLGLEHWRGHPAIALGLTWYQFLALALLALAGTTWLMRQRLRAEAVPAGP